MEVLVKADMTQPILIRRRPSALLSLVTFATLMATAGCGDDPLRLSLEIVGDGVVTSAPEGVDCKGPADCGKASWDLDSVKLQGAPQSGLQLAGWVILDEKEGAVVDLVEGSAPLTFDRAARGEHVIAVFGLSGGSLDPWRVGGLGGAAGSGGSATGGAASGGMTGSGGAATGGTSGSGGSTSDGSGGTSGCMTSEQCAANPPVDAPCGGRGQPDCSDYYSCVNGACIAGARK